MNIFHALWLALGTAALLAAAERDENTDPPEDVMSDDGQHQAEHIPTALDVTRADDEAAGIAAVAAAGHRAWDLHHAPGDETGRAA